MTHALPLPVDYFYQGIAIDPSATAVIDDKRRLSYAELQQEVEALALWLQRELPSSSRVALCAQNHADHVIAWLAIMVAGFIWVPINPKNGAVLNRELVAMTNPALLMCDRASLGEVPTNGLPHFILGETCHSAIDSLRRQPFSPTRPDPEAVMAIKFTGGTTGRPKGVLQSQRSVSAVVANMQAVFGFQSTDCNVAVAPLTHGASHYILPILAVGGCHRLLRQPEPESLLRVFREEGGSIAFMPPTLIYKLIDNGATAQDFPRLRHLTYSAAPMPPNRIEQVQQILGPRLSTVYGQTEAPMTITALSSAELSDSSLRTSVGRVCRNSEIAILGQDHQSLPLGQVGEIAVRGPIVMSGYLDNTEATQEALVNGWLLTGDLGYLDDRGYLFLAGRSKELIITGGFNVYPAEVENVLSAMAGVKESVVFGRPDEYWGECVEAAVVLTQEAPYSVADLREVLKGKLGAVKTPKWIYQVEALPRNPVGKVVRREVRDWLDRMGVKKV